MQWYFNGYESNPDYATGFGNYKTWILESYGWDTTEEELAQGCGWRRDFMNIGC